MRKSPWSRAVTLVLAFAMICTSVLTVPQTAQAASTPKEMTLSAKERTLYVGKSFTLKVKSVKPAKASKAVTFKSSNTKVATVSAKGKVTGKKVGKATITATSSSNKKLKATCRVTVRQQVEEIMVTNATRKRVVVPKGKALTLKTVVKPDNAANKGVDYIVRKPKIVTVSSSGKIRANKYGSTRIAIQSKDKQKKIVIIAFVPKVRVKTIKLNATKKSLDVGRTFRLKPTISPAKASVKMVTYQSSDPKIAYVSIGGNVRGVKPGKAVITATTLDGKKKAKCTITVNEVKAQSVKVNPESQEAIIGQQFTLSARISPSNATNQAVTWKSSNTEVVSIRQDGRATAVGVGEADVTATAKDGSGKFGVCKVTVLPEDGKLLIRSIEVTPSEKSLKVGESTALSAKLTLQDGTVVTEQNKDKYPITWVSDNQNVAIVDAETGRVTGVGVGKANINAKALDGSKEIGTCAVDVTPADLPTAPEVKLTEEKINLQEGAVRELTWTVTPAGTPVTWSSNNESVASVADGKVTAVKAGTAIITASVKGGNTASCEVNVTSTKPVVTLTEVEVNLQVGGSLSLKWSVEPVGTVVNWTTSNETVASVANGVITAKAVGTAEITASVAGGNSVKCKVNVTSSQGGSSEIILIQEELNMETGETVKLNWSVKPQDAKITWDSSDKAVAEVADGVITAKKEGTTTITASVEGGNTVSCTVTVKDPKKTEIILEDLDVNLLVGQKWKPSYTTNPPGAAVKWGVDRPEVATVDEKSGEITAVAKGTATVTGTVENGKPVTITVTVSEPQKPFVILAEEKLNLYIGYKHQLTYEVSSEEVEVIWKSSDNTKATVNENGEIEAKAEGTVTITGEVTGGNTVSCEVTVKAPETGDEELFLNQAEVSLQAGATMALQYTVKPEGTLVTAESSNPDKVEAVVNQEKSTVTVTAIAVGDAEVTIRTANGKSVKCMVHVTEPTPVVKPEIILAEKEVNLQVGAEKQLTYVTNPKDAVVTWTSNDDAKVTVSETGLVKANALTEEAVTITGIIKGGEGSEDSETVTCKVNVLPKQDETKPEISLQETSLKLLEGSEVTLNYKVTPEDAEVTWDDGDKNVVEVVRDENGKVTIKAIGVGNTTITATVKDGNTVTCKVEVISNETKDPHITITQTEINLRTGAEVTLDWSVDPADTVVNWKSSDEENKIAKVEAEDGKLKITAIGAGDVIITGTAANGKGNTVTCIVHVVEEKVEIILEEEKLNLVAGMTWQLNWTTRPEGVAVNWSSSDETVATVDEKDGKITALKNGTAVITGTAGGTSVTCIVTVTEPVITLNETEITLKLNQAEGFQLIPTVIPEELKAAIDKKEAELKWISDKTDVATVTEDGLVVPTPVDSDSLDDIAPIRNTNITAAIYIGGKVVATAVCSVTVIAEKNAEVKDEDNFIYVIDQNAEAYRIVVRGDQDVVLDKKMVENDTKLYVQKLNDIKWDNNFLKDYWNRFNLKTLKQSEILSYLFLRGGEPEVKDINANTKEITMRGRTVEVKRVDGTNSSSLIITYRNGGRTAYIDDIQANVEDGNVVITAQVGASAGGKRMGVKLSMSLDGKNVTFYRLVNGKERPVVTMNQENGTFELKVNQMYYDEFVDMFGTELDFLDQVKIYNLYY